MDWRTLHVMVASPCFGGMVGQGYMKSVLDLLLHGVRGGLAVSVELLGHDSLIPRARNALVARFLDHATATHLLFVDADIAFEPAQVLRMLALEEDVVAGMYPLKLLDWEAAGARPGEPPHAAALRYLGVPCTGAERAARDGFVTAEYAGTGFMLLRRAALERMAACYPETRYSVAHTAAAPDRSVNQYALFDCMIAPDTRAYLSEDYAFCHRWRAIGGRIWLDTQGRLDHAGAFTFAGRPDLRFPAAGVAA
jgi:hypothetical protein